MNQHRIPAWAKGLTLAMTLWFCNASMLSAQVDITGYESFFEGSTFGRVTDFDFDPARTAEYQNSYGPDLTETFEYKDTVEIGQNDVGGGVQSRTNGNSILYGTPNGYAVYADARSASAVVNASSQSVNLTSFTITNGLTDVQIKGSTTLAGKAIVIFGRQGILPEWGFYETFGATSSVSMGTRFNVSFNTPDQPFLPPPVIEAKSTTAIYVEGIDTMGDLETFTISQDVRATKLDGFMDPMGNIPDEEWPYMFAESNVFLNILNDAAGTGVLPLKPILDFPLGLDIQGLELPSDVQGPGKLGDFAQFPFLPTDAYYELPFADENEIDFATLDATLISSIADLAGLTGEVQVLVDDVDLGFFSNGQSIDFEQLLGTGVSSFTLMDPGGSFSAQSALKFHFDDTTAFLYASSVSAVPEPAAGGLVALVLVGWITQVRPRRVGCNRGKLTNHG